MEASRAIGHVLWKKIRNQAFSPAVTGGDIRVGDIMDEIQKFRKNFDVVQLKVGVPNHALCFGRGTISLN